MKLNAIYQFGKFKLVGLKTAVNEQFRVYDSALIHTFNLEVKNIFEYKDQIVTIGSK